MRVISGCARGVKLEDISNEDLRPTTDRVKEALFSIIQFQIEGSYFLDLFGGTGQMGIEAASRGAKRVVINDLRMESFNIIKRNVEKSRLGSLIDVVNYDALDFLSNTSLRFDIAFLDPPYMSDVLNKVALELPKIMNENGFIITETPKQSDVMDKIQNYVLIKKYGYGKIGLNVYKDIRSLEGEV